MSGEEFEESKKCIPAFQSIHTFHDANGTKWRAGIDFDGSSLDSISISIYTKMPTGWVRYRMLISIRGIELFRELTNNTLVLSTNATLPSKETFTITLTTLDDFIRMKITDASNTTHIDVNTMRIDQVLPHLQRYGDWESSSDEEED